MSSHHLLRSSDWGICETFHRLPAPKKIVALAAFFDRRPVPVCLSVLCQIVYCNETVQDRPVVFIGGVEISIGTIFDP